MELRNKCCVRGFAHRRLDRVRTVHIITWHDKPIKSLKTAINTAKRKVKVSDRKITMYNLGNAFVTTLLHLGVDIHTIANISGHDVRTMLKHYAHAMDDVRLSAIGRLPTLNYTAATHQRVQKGARKNIII